MWAVVVAQSRGCGFKSMPGAGLFSINIVLEKEILLLPFFLFPIIIINTINGQCVTKREINPKRGWDRSDLKNE